MVLSVNLTYNPHPPLSPVAAAHPSLLVSIPLDSVTCLELYLSGEVCLTSIVSSDAPVEDPGDKKRCRIRPPDPLSVFCCHPSCPDRLYEYSGGPFLLLHVMDFSLGTSLTVAVGTPYSSRPLHPMSVPLHIRVLAKSPTTLLVLYGSFGSIVADAFKVSEDDRDRLKGGGEGGGKRRLGDKLSSEMYGSSCCSEVFLDRGGGELSYVCYKGLGLNLPCTSTCIVTTLEWKSGEGGGLGRTDELICKGEVVDCCLSGLEDNVLTAAFCKGGVVCLKPFCDDRVICVDVGGGLGSIRKGKYLDGWIHVEGSRGRGRGRVEDVDYFVRGGDGKAEEEEEEEEEDGAKSEVEWKKAALEDIDQLIGQHVDQGVDRG